MTMLLLSAIAKMGMKRGVVGKSGKLRRNRKSPHTIRSRAASAIRKLQTAARLIFRAFARERGSPQ